MPIILRKVVVGVSELKKTISSLVEMAVEAYAEGFRARHEAEVEDPEGIINMKIHNVFIEGWTISPEYAILTASITSWRICYSAFFRIAFRQMKYLFPIKDQD
jgi:hypothetical protein